MMNAEILKERMRPEVIKDNIGRDQWDYSNDKVIGTGNGWNYNVFDPDLKRVTTKTTGRFAEEDSLMRASRPAFAENSGENKSVTIYEEQPNQENVRSYADYADFEVLDKEYAIGKSLLLKALKNVTPEYLNSLREHSNPTEQEIHIARTLIKLVWCLIKSNNDDSLEEWSNICNYLNEDFITQLNSIPEKIDRRNYNKKEIEHFRQDFKLKSSSEENSGLLHIFKEVVCESF